MDDMDGMDAAMGLPRHPRVSFRPLPNERQDTRPVQVSSTDLTWGAAQAIHMIRHDDKNDRLSA